MKYMLLSMLFLWSSSSAQKIDATDFNESDYPEKSFFEAPSHQKGQKIDTTDFSYSYYHKKSIFEAMPRHEGRIVFLGNSITEQGRWRELFENNNIINRGIGGDRTDGILYRLKEITDSKPIKIFLLIGTNDLRYGRSIEYIVEKTQHIIKNIKLKSPNTKIYLQSVLPTYDREERPIEKIKSINEGYQKIALEEKVTYIDLFSHFLDCTGNLDRKYSLDGLHLKGIGYLKWKTLIEDYINH